MKRASPKTSQIIIGFIALVLTALIVSAFTVTGVDRPALSRLEPAAFRLTNVIKNGDFEDNPRNNVATGWQAYDNGGAHFGWYGEQWPEAVNSGQYSQLMEIFRVESFRPNRVMAIYQTVDVVPDMYYMLTIHALMRSDAPAPLRNKGDYAMAWGIDPQGRGKYHYVTNWVTMPMVEQLRLGSNGPSEDSTHLYYQLITATISTANINKLTLFIRGEKIQPTGTELNFNVDDVSLIGPYTLPTPTPLPTPTATRRRYPTVTRTPTPTTTPNPAELPETGQDNPLLAVPVNLPPADQNSLPSAGGILPPIVSPGVLALAGLVLTTLAAGAARALWRKRPK
jgi:hypothetical protein